MIIVVSHLLEFVGSALAGSNKKVEQVALGAYARKRTCVTTGDIEFWYYTESDYFGTDYTPTGPPSISQLVQEINQNNLGRQVISPTITGLTVSYSTVTFSLPKIGEGSRVQGGDHYYIQFYIKELGVFDNNNGLVLYFADNPLAKSWPLTGGVMEDLPASDSELSFSFQQIVQRLS